MARGIRCADRRKSKTHLEAQKLDEVTENEKEVSLSLDSEFVEGYFYGMVCGAASSKQLPREHEGVEHLPSTFQVYKSVSCKPQIILRWP